MVAAGTRIRVTDDLSNRVAREAKLGEDLDDEMKLPVEDRLGVGSIQDGRIPES